MWRRGTWRGDVGDMVTWWWCGDALDVSSRMPVIFFDASSMVGSDEGWWKVDGGGWWQWMRVVMLLMAVVDGLKKSAV